ncbi:MAG: sulfatase-like hydrolase/transferase [Polaribacter sp.]|nr:sulfatase-like hydrolase/transferase [Polaribacter sp.]
MRFLKTLIIIFLGVFTFSNYAQKKTKKPLNIIWLSTEDMGPILGAYGNKIIKTPNLDKLANEGVRYTNAYATVGVCAPSRFSIITGVYSARLGAHNMRTGDYHNYKTPEEVKYRTYIGVKDKTGRNIPEYEIVTPPEVKPFTQILRKKGYYTANNFKCDYQFNAPFTAWDEVSSKVSFKDAPKGKPFFYVRNFLVTHESRIWQRKNIPLTVKPEDVIIPDYYPDIPEVRNDIARKYSNIEEMDRQVGVIMEQLKNDNLLDNTIIMFWSDHGGNLLRQKRAVGNSGLNVPLIIRYPDKKMAGKIDERIVSLMDLGPTVLSLLGIEKPAHYDGKAFAGKFEETPRKYAFGTADRFDETTDMQRSVLDGRFVYIKNFMPQLPLIYRNKYREQIPMNAKLIELNRQKKLKGDAAYIFMETKPREELYDLKNDPYEVHNLANDMNYRERLTEYRNALSNWQLEIGDKGFIPEHDLVEMFWPEMLQPKTENVLISSAKKNTIVLSCKTEGASIGYQTGKAIGTKSWQLYYKPIKIKGKEKLVARAIRIGYKASEITSN